MATAQRTHDHDEIRTWVEQNNGHPAVVEGTGGVLRIDFGQPEERLEQVDWDRFFDIFDRSNIEFLYDPNGHMVKFVAASRGGGSRKKSSSSRKKSTSSRKKSTSSRKKSTGSRKKSTGGRKKSTGGRKKSTDGRKKSTGTRKKSTGGRKKSTGGRKKSTASRKSTGTRKKSTSGRKKSTGGRKKSTAGRKKSTAGRKKSTGGRKYGPKAQRKVRRSMEEMKEGKLRSGRSGKKVTSRKQAIAIGLSEARRSGGKVPPNPNRKRSRKKSR